MWNSRWKNFLSNRTLNMFCIIRISPWALNGSLNLHSVGRNLWLLFRFRIVTYERFKSYSESAIRNHFRGLSTPLLSIARSYQVDLAGRWMHQAYDKSGWASTLPTARVTYAREIKYACMLQAQHASDSRVVIPVALISSEMMSYISWNFNWISRKERCVERYNSPDRN